MRPRLKLWHKGLILVSVPLVFELIFVLALHAMLKQAELEVAHARRSREVTTTLERILKRFFDAGASLLSYGTTRSSVFKRRYELVVREIPEDLNSIEHFAGDTPRQRESIRRSRLLARRMLELFDEAKANFDENRRAFVFLTTQETREKLETMMAQLLQEMHAFIQESRKIEKSSPIAEHQARQLIYRILLIGVVFNIMVALLLAFYFSNGIVRRVRTITDNSRRFARGDRLVEPIGGSDEIAQLDRVFHSMADTVAEAARRRREFVGMISHDLRAPLMSIRSTLTLILEGAYGSLSERGISGVRMAEDNTKRLIKLINELLDLEKLEAGQMQLHRVAMPIADIIHKAVASVGALAEGKGISISSPADETTVLVDPDRLVQVLVNLLANAVKFSSPGDEVIISTCQVDKELEVRVSDLGPGIPEDMKTSIFARFCQLDPERDANEKGGSGLGLAIAKAIVEAHGGTIGVEANSGGKGSSFWFTVELANVPAATGID